MVDAGRPRHPQANSQLTTARRLTPGRHHETQARPLVVTPRLLLKICNMTLGEYHGFGFTAARFRLGATSREPSLDGFGFSRKTRADSSCASRTNGKRATNPAFHDGAIDSRTGHGIVSSYQGARPTQRFVSRSFHFETAATATQAGRNLQPSVLVSLFSTATDSLVPESCCRVMPSRLAIERVP